ncbi:HAD family phosphatase [archaeon]|nr:HAD family phosphatase [archaeon]
MKALLIDLDGTLVRETEELDEIVMTKILKKYHIKKSIEFNGYNLDQYFNLLIKDKKLAKKIKKEFLESYHKLLIKTKLQINPEIVNVLIKNKGQRLGLVTSNSKKITNLILNKIGMINLFEVVITGEDVKNHKPHPEPYLKALQLMNLSSSDCLVFEDSAIGVKAALDAGIKCKLIGD